MEKMLTQGLLLVIIVGSVVAVPYMEALTNNAGDIDAYVPVEAYDDVSGDRYLTFPQKRTCKRRGTRCTYWGENECCNGACKCNIWGQNCKCSRPGLFATWG